jgi:hypothetical protein
MPHAERDLARRELWQSSLARSLRRRAARRQRERMRRMSVPLVMAAAAAAVKGPAVATAHRSRASEPAEVAGQRLLSLGSTGSAVKALQRALRLPVDGDFGPRTERAVRTFQARHGLMVDGLVGPKTLAALAQSRSGGGGILHRGDRGARVAAVQRALGVHPHRKIGPPTERAVLAFQRANGARGRRDRRPADARSAVFAPTHGGRWLPRARRPRPGRGPAAARPWGPRRRGLRADHASGRANLPAAARPRGRWGASRRPARRRTW